MNKRGTNIPLFPVDSPQDKPKSQERTFIEPNTLKGVNHIKLEFPGLVPTDIFSTVNDEIPPDDTNADTKEFEFEKTLLLMSVYQLSSFLGTSGSGRLLNAFTLLPGEESNITIRTFSRTSTKENHSTSIVDSYSEQTESRFLQERKEEDWSLKYREENEAMSASAGGKASWGWGSAKASGSWSHDTHTQRTDFTYDLTKTVKNHTQKASSNRNIQIGASSEIQTEESKFESVERKLKNINLDRGLNYKFHQLNQEYHTVLHVIDVQVGYMRKIKGKQLIFEKVSIEDIDTLLTKRVNPDHLSTIKESIQEMLFSFMAYNKDELDISTDKNDCKDNKEPLEGQLEPIKIIEMIKKPAPDNTEFPRFKKNTVEFKYQTDTGPESFCISGYIVNLTTQILRTDGVRIEPQLGVRGALDEYGKNKQIQEVWSQYLDNKLKLSLIKREELAQELLQKVMDAPPREIKDLQKKAWVFHLLYNCLEDEHESPFALPSEDLQADNPTKEE